MMTRRPGLSRRVIEREELETASKADAARNLDDLVKINRWFGGYSVMNSALRPFLPGTVLDVGAATGDTARAIQAAYPDSIVTSADLRQWFLLRASEPRVCADAFALPFASGSFDVVACSLFLHHFENEAVVRLLREFRRVATRAVVAVDLERAALAWYFLPCTQVFFRWHPMTVNDGCLSVAAAFSKKELKKLAVEADLPNARVRRHMPWFRLSLVSSVQLPA